MAPARKRSRLEKAKHFLKGGGVIRDDSDDELGDVDHPWQWIFAEKTANSGDKSLDNNASTSRKRKASAAGQNEKLIVGAQMGSFKCRIGDAVLLKAEGNEAWVGLICDLFDGEDGEKMANFMWFSTPKEIRNKIKKRTDVMENELYLTPSWDDNPLTTVNGKAAVVSPTAFAKRHPSGRVPRTSKDFGKIFVCRRGCNTRTATYTEEFVWEDLYGGETDIPALIQLVKSQTKATRKRSGKGAPPDRDTEEYIAADEEDDGVPKTPKKRRRLNDAATTPTPQRAKLTPKKFLTPTSKRIVIKKPLEFTPLGTRILSPSVLSSPFQLARNQLHVSAVPASLPCREDEFSEVYSVLEKAITDGSGSCIYIAGTPGTGKTATVREVVAQLNASVLEEELDDFIFVEINGMKVTDPHQSYSLLWEALRGDRVSPSHALELLDREFSAPSPRRVPCVVLMDELDQLVTKNQSVMYNFFNWPGLRHSRLIVLAVANTMDLPERTLSNKISSRLGLHRITFRGYTHDQLMQIIQSRLENVPGNIVHPDAVQFASRKVAAVSGDARRALDICRRAVEIAETEALDANTNSTNEDDAPLPDTPSRTGRGSKASKGTNSNAGAESTLQKKAALAPKPGIVTIATIKRAIAEATSSPLQQYLRSLPLASKLFLAALLARIRRTGIAEAVLGDVADEAKRLGTMSQLKDVKDSLLVEEAWDSLGASRTTLAELNSSAVNVAGATRAHGAAGDKVARVLGMNSAAAGLLEAGLIGMESRRGERVGRIQLTVGTEEVLLALRDDDSVKGLGFA
ncbi:P-loop containing nucleoside triphosphate hydrolase protein [Rhizodiscina lignyota]|uniref:Origin recognition complex subunit 1 n=1 Tax=Rhizodiscina lignyota TaxID=1504668 RepID=A0A9P4I903_9PEZI|nr:P-loop containing nucleoside triphosphate hydrolase protein [Rhizodiscina lignyota]